LIRAAIAVFGKIEIRVSEAVSGQRSAVSNSPAESQPEPSLNMPFLLQTSADEFAEEMISIGPDEWEAMRGAFAGRHHQPRMITISTPERPTWIKAHAWAGMRGASCRGCNRAPETGAPVYKINDVAPYCPDCFATNLKERKPPSTDPQWPPQPNLDERPIEDQYDKCKQCGWIVHSSRAYAIDGVSPYCKACHATHQQIQEDNAHAASLAGLVRCIGCKILTGSPGTVMGHGPYCSFCVTTANEGPTPYWCDQCELPAIGYNRTAHGDTPLCQSCRVAARVVGGN
jgi:hypothetical protein